MQDWLDEVAAELGVDPGIIDVDAILDLARAAAHGVQRPAAPLTTFLAGYALGAAGADHSEVVALCNRLAARADDRADGRAARELSE